LVSQPKIRPASHSVDIAGESVELPLAAISEPLAVPLLMVIDMGVGFGDRIGRALADRLMDKKPDIIVGAATLGIDADRRDAELSAQSHHSSARSRLSKGNAGGICQRFRQKRLGINLVGVSRAT
jgi:hypothetical protein